MDLIMVLGQLFVRTATDTSRWEGCIEIENTNDLRIDTYCNRINNKVFANK